MPKSFLTNCNRVQRIVHGIINKNLQSIRIHKYTIEETFEGKICCIKLDHGNKSSSIICIHNIKMLYLPKKERDLFKKEKFFSINLARNRII